MQQVEDHRVKKKKKRVGRNWDLLHQGNCQKNWKLFSTLNYRRIEESIRN